MTVSRPRLLQVGDDILLRGEQRSVEAVSGAMVRLVDVVGTVSVVPLAEVLSDPGFVFVGAVAKVG
jgi:hypothetical protein